MGNIIGEPIPSYVGKQIDKRQEIYGKGTLNTELRTNEEISYLNSRTAWIKLASGVSLDSSRLDILEDNTMIRDVDITQGSSLAQQNVLFNGLAYKEDVNVQHNFTDSSEEITSEMRLGSRKGIANNFRNPVDSAYGVGNRRFGDPDFGFAPMPGIIDANIKSLNRGSLKKATINIKAHNKHQLDIIDVLYMRLGYTVLLEWGNNKYFNNNGDFENMGPTLIEREFFSSENDRTDYKKWLPLIEKERERHAGNYEAMFGVISNFSWTFESNGSYSIKIDIMSMGDVIESLKANVPVSNKSSLLELTKEQFLESSRGQQLWNENTPLGNLSEAQFLDRFGQRNENGNLVVEVGLSELAGTQPIDISKANNAGYFGFSKEEINKVYNSHKLQNQRFTSWLDQRKKEVENGNNTPFLSFPISFQTTKQPTDFKTREEQIRVVEEAQSKLEERITNFENYFTPESPFPEIGNQLGAGLTGTTTTDDETGSPTNAIHIEKTGDGDRYWYFVNGNYDLWLLSKDKGGFTTYSGNSELEKEYRETLKSYTEEHKRQVEARETLIQNQITLLKESKLSYLFFSIEEMGSKLFQETQEGGKYSKNGIAGNALPIYLRDEEQNRIGGVLNANKDIVKNLENLGLNYRYGNDNADIIFFDKMSIAEKGNVAYYIRFGKLLEYIQSNVFPKIVSGESTVEELEADLLAGEIVSGTPLLNIDFDADTNIMYTIPNQISTNPQVCLIRNNTTFGDNKKQFFVGLDNYVGPGDIPYGQVMNIYLNFNYLKNLLESEGIVSPISIYKFLSNICTDINDSLGGVNNLEPILDEKRNTIVIIDQTSIPGKNQLMQDLGIIPPTPYIPPILEVFGYNGVTSNFVRNIGLTTSITKEYATMITIGATAAGYIPGEEATAFSKWNIGIEDRFKNALTDGSSDTDDPVRDFEEENEEIKNQYVRYITQPILNIVGVNYEKVGDGFSTTLTPNSELIRQNTAAVINHNKYLQASSSITNPESKNTTTSVGFLPFNLSLEMDGIGGFKIYNKLDVNTKFLPSNYPQSMDFVITGVDHKLSNNEWITSLNTIGTGKGTNKPNTISLISTEAYGNISHEVRQAAKFINPEDLGIGTSTTVIEDWETTKGIATFPSTYRKVISVDTLVGRLNPAYRDRFRSFFNEFIDNNLGYKLIINATYRTFKRSAELRKENIKNAFPGKSAHNYGVALDFNLETPNGTLLRKKENHAMWVASGIVDIAIKNNIQWGGNFSGYQDNIHFAIKEWNGNNAIAAKSKLNKVYGLGNNPTLGAYIAKNPDGMNPQIDLPNVLS